MPLTPERQKFYRHRKGVAVWEYLQEHPCVDCGEADPVVLDFDHVRGVKKAGVGRMIAGTHSMAVLFAEIAKCDVRCANCHRRVTAKRGGFYAYVESPAPKPASPPKLDPCGTRTGYRRGCRCKECREAQRSYQADWNAKRRAG